MRTFPIAPGTKKPAVTGWQKYEGHVPQEGETYGIPTSEENGFFVLDLDMKGNVNGIKTIIDYAEQHGGLPDTYAHHTPSGGLHLFWKWRSGVGNRIGVLPGVDVRGAGGYVCGGHNYPEVDASVAIAEAPSWLLELIKKPLEEKPIIEAHAISPDHTEYEWRVRQAEHYLGEEPPCIEGHGEAQKQIWRIATQLCRTWEFSIDDAMWLLASYNTRCIPPWSEHELRRTLQNAANKSTKMPGDFSQHYGKEPPTPSAPDGCPWRKRYDPNHQYTYDLATCITGGVVGGTGGGVKPAIQKWVTSLIAGPGAFPTWIGVWQYDTFRERVVAVNPPLRLESEDPNRGVQEVDLNNIQLWFQGQHGIVAPVPQVRAAIETAAKMVRYHPVRDYLNDLPKPSLGDASRYFDGIAGRLWGATERDEIESAHLRRFAIAAVRRIKVPGTKVDTMLVLAGEQGINKSKFAEYLFTKEFFLNQLPDLASKEASQALLGRWGAEFAELQSFSRSAETTKKEFLSRNEDKYRPPYARDFVTYPRQCVFIGTTNEDDFLQDATGDRRYDVCRIDRAIDLSFERDEFWAAACVLESAGETHFRPVPPQEENAGFRQAEDPWTEKVLDFAEAEIKANGHVKPGDVLARCLAIPTADQDPKQVARLRGILRRAYGASKVIRVGEKTHRAYTPKVPR